MNVGQTDAILNFWCNGFNVVFCCIKKRQLLQTANHLQNAHQTQQKYSLWLSGKAIQLYSANPALNPTSTQESSVVCQTEHPAIIPSMRLKI